MRSEERGARSARKDKQRRQTPAAWVARLRFRVFALLAPRSSLLDCYRRRRAHDAPAAASATPHIHAVAGSGIAAGTTAMVWALVFAASANLPRRFPCRS